MLKLAFICVSCLACVFAQTQANSDVALTEACHSSSLLQADKSKVKALLGAGREDVGEAEHAASSGAEKIKEEETLDVGSEDVGEAERAASSETSDDGSEDVADDGTEQEEHAASSEENLATSTVPRSFHHYLSYVGQGYCRGCTKYAKVPLKKQVRPYSLQSCADMCNNDKSCIGFYQRSGDNYCGIYKFDHQAWNGHINYANGSGGVHCYRHTGRDNNDRHGRRRRR